MVGNTFGGCSEAIHKFPRKRTDHDGFMFALNPEVSFGLSRRDKS